MGSNESPGQGPSESMNDIIPEHAQKGIVGKMGQSGLEWRDLGQSRREWTYMKALGKTHRTLLHTSSVTSFLRMRRREYEEKRVNRTFSENIWVNRVMGGLKRKPWARPIEPYYIRHP